MRSTSAEARNGFGRYVVMVAEDDPEVRRTSVRLLGSAGYRVLESADAASAIALLEQRGAEVELLCTDGIMPGGGTRQLIDHYLSIRPCGEVEMKGRPLALLALDADEAAVSSLMPTPVSHARALQRFIGHPQRTHRLAHPEPGHAGRKCSTSIPVWAA